MLQSDVGSRQIDRTIGARLTRVQSRGPDSIDTTTCAIRRVVQASGGTRVGAFIAAGLPVALAVAVDPGWSLALWTAAFYLVAESVFGQAIEPLLYGHSTGLSPLAVVVSAIFWSWMWGPVGLILFMPITLCLVVLGRYADRLELLSVLFGDKPALTPVESFYQRTPAVDPDEAQDHAEIVLKKHSLSADYDEVALEGLRLAAADAERGVSRPEQLERLKNTIGEFVEELAVHEEREPAPEKPGDLSVALPSGLPG